MCRSHLRLEDRQIARDMRAHGIPLDLREFPQTIRVQQRRSHFGASVSSRSLYLGHLGTSVILVIRILNCADRRVTFNGFQLSLPWSSTPVLLFPDPADAHASRSYKLPGDDSAGFNASVLIPQSGTLKPGESVEGVLAGYDLEPIPASVPHGAKVKAVLNIETTPGEYVSETFILVVDRAAKCGCKAKSKPRRQRAGLFERRDVPKMESAQSKQVEADPDSDVIPIESFRRLLRTAKRSPSHSTVQKRSKQPQTGVDRTTTKRAKRGRGSKAGGGSAAA